MKILLLTLEPPLKPKKPARGNMVRIAHLQAGLQAHDHEVIHLFKQPNEAAVLSADDQQMMYRDADELKVKLAEVTPDAIILGYWAMATELPETVDCPVIIDFIAPRPLEALFEVSETRDLSLQKLLINLARGDFFMVGNQRQADLLVPYLIQAGLDIRENIPIGVVSIAAEPGLPEAKNTPQDNWLLVGGGVNWPWRNQQIYIDTIADWIDNTKALANVVLFGGDYPSLNQKGSKKLNKLNLTRAVHSLGLHSYADYTQFIQQQAHIGLELAEYNVERYYSQSFRAMEFLRHGIPVICNDYSEFAGLIQAEKAGWTITHADELPALLDRIIADPDDYQRRSANALRLIQTHFLPVDTVNQLIKYLSNPVRTSKAPVSEGISVGRAGLVGNQDDQQRITDLGNTISQQVNDQLWTHVVPNLKESISQQVSQQVSHQLTQNLNKQLQQQKASINQQISDQLNSQLPHHMQKQVYEPLTTHLPPLITGSVISQLTTAAREASFSSRIGIGRPNPLRLIRKATRRLDLHHPRLETPKRIARKSMITFARLFGGRAQAGQPGNIVIVTRADLYPTDHGGAVKIVETARALSLNGRDVAIVTSERDRYWLYKNGERHEVRLPKWLGRISLPGRFSSLLHHAKDVPFSNAFLYLPLTDNSFLWRTVFVARQINANVYQAEFPAYVRACRFAKLVRGGKVGLVQHNVEYDRLRDQEPEMTQAQYERLKQLEIDYCNLSDVVICVSENDRQKLAADGVYEHKLFVVPHGVDLTTFDSAQPRDIRAELGWKEDDKVLVYHGTYQYPPNLEAIRMLVKEILPRLHTQGIHPKVLAVGRNPPAESLHEDVHFTGSVEIVAEYLKAADIAVVPLMDGGGTRMKIIDYFACALPVVSTAKGIEGIPVENGSAAFIDDDWDQLAAHIETLLTDNEKRTAMSAAGRAYASELDWRELVKDYLAHYSKA